MFLEEVPALVRLGKGIPAGISGKGEADVRGDGHVRKFAEQRGLIRPAPGRLPVQADFPLRCLAEPVFVQNKLLQGGGIEEAIGYNREKGYSSSDLKC